MHGLAFIAIIFILIGLHQFLRPRQAYMFGRRWMLGRNSELSQLGILYIRVCGVVLIFFGYYILCRLITDILGGEDMFELVFLFFLGLVFIVMGYLIWKKEQITLINSYHYKYVSEDNKKAYVKDMGRAVILIGIGIVATGVIDFLTKTLLGWFCFGVCFVLALYRMHKTQQKYNGSWF